MKEITYGKFRNLADDLWGEAHVRDKRCFSDVLQNHLLGLGVLVKNRRIKTLREARRAGYNRAYNLKPTSHLHDHVA